MFRFAIILFSLLTKQTERSEIRQERIEMAAVSAQKLRFSQEVGRNMRE